MTSLHSEIEKILGNYYDEYLTTSGAATSILHHISTKLKEAMPNLRNSPNPLKQDIVHNKIEKRDMAFNDGWNTYRKEVLSIIDELTTPFLNESGDNN